MIFHFGTSQLMCQNKLLGVVGGVLGWYTLLIFQKLFTGKSVFLINQFTFWNFSNVNTIKCIFAHDSSKKFGGCPQKMDSGPKNSTFGPKKAHFGQSGPKNGPPSGQTATYRKTKGIQSCLMIWGTYDPIESGPSDPKKWGLYGCSVKKCRFWPILRCWLWMSLAAKIWVRLSFAVARYYTWCLFWIFIAWNVTEL